MKDFDSSISKKLCLRLFKKAVQQKEEMTDALTIELVCELINDYSLGGYRNKLFEGYLEANKNLHNERRKRISLN